MPFHYDNLDPDTRRLMLEELEHDVGLGNLYLSPRLSPKGVEDYPNLLRDAFVAGDEQSLAAEIRRRGRLLLRVPRRTRSGLTMARVPVNAHETLAEGEFNRFYIRALCLRALDEGLETVLIYRAKRVGSPRPESERRVGRHVDPERLLRDLRHNVGVGTALGVPSGPNSGLSVRLPVADLGATSALDQRRSQSHSR